MDEVFSNWPGLTNQPISHPDIEFSRMTIALSKKTHVLLDMQ
jgi:hypothetical protein